MVFSFLLSAAAKPGEAYALTGREKSIFSIFQADMKAYPDLYEGEDINAYYQAFKALNNLDGGRKLKQGEELMFPHTQKSKEIEEAEKAEAARAKAEAEAAAARARAREAVAAAEQDTHASPEEIERANAYAERKRARQNAIYQFQHWQLPSWLEDHSTNIVESMDALVAKACEKVDEQFAEALVLHRYPDKNIHVIEFEKPDKVKNCFFLAMKREANGLPYLYALEKGIGFFGTGDVSVLFEQHPEGGFSELGGRKYNDLSSFVQDIDEERPATTEEE